MRRFATTAVLLASLLSAVSAHAFDVARPLQSHATPNFTLVAQVCDNGVNFNAFFQADIRRYGNEFNFGAGARLSSIEMVHDGWETLFGPYMFDVELWDVTTCTLIASADNLAASDAFDGAITESFNLCPFELEAAGAVGVMIDANSCSDPSDCYPDISWDNTTPECQWIITPGAPSLCQFSPTAGDFLLRVDLDNCPTPTRPVTWGTIKQKYR